MENPLRGRPTRRVVGSPSMVEPDPPHAADGSADSQLDPEGNGEWGHAVVDALTGQAPEGAPHARSADLELGLVGPGFSKARPSSPASPREPFGPNTCQIRARRLPVNGTIEEAFRWNERGCRHSSRPQRCSSALARNGYLMFRTRSTGYPCGGERARRRSRRTARIAAWTPQRRGTIMTAPQRDIRLRSSWRTGCHPAFQLLHRVAPVGDAAA